MSLRIDTATFHQDSPPERDLRTRLLWFYLLFVGLMLIVGLLLARAVNSQLKRAAETAVLRQAQTLTRHLESTTVPPAADWLAFTSLDPLTSVYLLREDGTILQAFHPDDALLTTLNGQIWQNNIIQQAVLTNEGIFTSTHPDGETWLAAFATSSDGRYTILLHQPTAVVYDTIHTLNQIWAIAFLMVLASGMFSWVLLSRQIIQPLEQLGEYSGLIRWRGQMRPDEKAHLDKLADRPDQIGELARSLMAMEADINQRFLQLATLLETSRVVAASLEAEEVLNNILDQVQNLFDVERCAVVALDKRADVFRIRASRSLSANYVEQLRIAPTEPNSPSMRALRNQMPIQVANTETDLAFAVFRPRARAEGYQSVLAIPLQTTHAPPAVLLLYKSAPYRYSYTELELASSFGHHASIAMENAALFARTDEQLQEQTRRLEAIVESLEDGLILEGIDGRVLYCNHQASDWLPVSRREAQQQTGSMLFNHILTTTTEPAQVEQQYNWAMAGHGSRTFDLVQALRNGRCRDLRIHLFDVTDAGGEVLGRGQLWQDITKDKELDRMKSALLSTVSHELRTPLATIKGYASTLLASDVEWDANAQQEFLQTISDETDRLTALVKNLLDMSRIEAGMLDIQCEVYALNDLLHEVMQGFAPLLNGRVYYDLAADLSPVAMDVSRIGTVIRNLVENAVKYSPADASIVLRTWQQDGRVTCVVRDFGPGIPAEWHDKIFDRFFRADNRLTRQVGGTGLGLAICKGFIEAHNGRVWVQSANPGSQFGFTLPIENDCLE